MKEFSVSMALVDFIPVILYLIAAVILQRDLYTRMNKGPFALFCCGTINVVLAGALKALHKLLYAAGVCDFHVLSAMFMPLQGLGQLFAGLAMLAYVFRKQKKGAMLAAAVPPVYNGTFVFVGMMVAGLAGLDAGLCVLAARMKKHKAIPLFILSFIMALGMGYLSSRDFDRASMNWIAEGVNAVGQAGLLAGTWILHKVWRKEERN